MSMVFALIGLVLLIVVMARLVRLVARDGLGSNPPPRSHHAELGSWVDRELKR